MIKHNLSFSVPKPETGPDVESSKEQAYRSDTELREILQYLRNSENRIIIEESLVTFPDYWEH
jgi:hypothetical protein